MKNTERIELYLLGKLSEEDKKAFEQELETNSELKEEFLLQQEVIEFVQQNVFVKDIEKAHQRYLRNNRFSTLWIWGGIFLLSATLASYFFFNNEKLVTHKLIEHPIVENNNIEKESIKIIVPNDSTQEKTIIQPVEQVSETVELYQRKHKKAEKFIFNTNQEKEIVTKGGVKLRFPADAFGKNIPTIQLEIEEYLTKSDMILADLTTLTNDNKQLESEGMLYVKAISLRTKKEVNLLKNIEVLFPKKDEKVDFKPFFGQENERREIQWNLIEMEKSLYYEKQSVIDQIFFKEKKVLKSTSDIEKKIEKKQKLTEREADYYVFSLSSLGWINCDRFLNSEKSKFTMEVNNPYQNNLRLVFKKYKSILPGYQNAFQNIVEGEEVSLIGIVRVNDELKVAKTDFVTKKGFVPTLEYQSISEKELVEFAKSFDK